MENASKALIIAGAILLSILIIALGVYIFTVAKGSMDLTSVDALTLEQFNSQFTQYDGRRLGSSIKTLINTVITNGTTNGGSAEKLPDVHYTPGTGPAVNANLQTITTSVQDTKSTELGSLRSKISETHYYYTRFDVNTEGFVSDIYIYYDKADFDAAAAANP